MNTDINITILGAGVVGLAIASKLSESYQNIFVIEKNRQFGQETSSRNSEVIHSGIYYPTGSMKAKFCIEGRKLIYDLCEKENIAYNKCGKLIVANDELEVNELFRLLEKGNENGVSELRIISKGELKEIEPNVAAIKALYSTETGIIDTHGLMKYFETKAILNQVEFSYLSSVENIEKLSSGGYKIEVEDPSGDIFSFTSSTVINSAGLEADKISAMVGINPPEYKVYFCKGEYFSINPPKNRMVSRLIYPVPPKNLTGLGIHATVDLANGLKLGPNTIYLKENIYDYTIDESHLDDFYISAKKYLPFLEKEDLSPDQAGIRPKLQAKGEPVRDFIIQEESGRGFAGFINLIGIESPGLTASPAIANYIKQIVESIDI